MDLKNNSLPIFYENPNITPAGGFLTDSAYQEARKCLPFIGTDTFIVDTENQCFLLPFRKATPARGLWGIGGGLKVGKTPIEAMAKAFERETSLRPSKERFHERSDLLNAVMWCTEEIMNFHIPFFITLTESELDIVQKNLDGSEYDKSRGLTQVNHVSLKKAYEQGDVSPGAVDVLDFYLSGIFE